VKSDHGIENLAFAIDSPASAQELVIPICQPASLPPQILLAKTEPIPYIHTP